MAPFAKYVKDSGGLLGSLGSLLGLGGGGGSGFTSSTDLGGGMVWNGEYAEGTDYVPRTGLALVHKGESITPASQNSKAARAPITVTNVFYVTGQTDRRSQAQIAAAAGEGVNRALARNT